MAIAMHMENVIVIDIDIGNVIAIDIVTAFDISIAMRID